MSLVLMLSVLVWSVSQPLMHGTSLPEGAIAAQTEIVIDHEHGVEGDILPEWSIHGHSHNAADHEHQLMVLLPGRGEPSFFAFSTRKTIQAVLGTSTLQDPLERPPRV